MDEKVETVNERIEEQLKSEKQQRIEDSIRNGNKVTGFLEVCLEGYGFIRNDNYLTSPEDVYVSKSQITRFRLKTGDFITGYVRESKGNERFNSLMYIEAINEFDPELIKQRQAFETLTPIFPNQKLKLERTDSIAMRIVDLLSPIGKGQRAIIVSPPKAGKTTLLKNIAKSITNNHPEVYLLIVLIDERPEEVTDFKEAIQGKHVEVLYSTFDEAPERHKKVSEMVIERAKRLVESKQDVVILLDSITRLSRAYNILSTNNGRTLSGGLDPNALFMPKRFFGAARNMREGGSLTIVATALVDTGSKMDDVIYEEFKGTGNSELTLSRELQERRIFPAIDIKKSSTRRDDLLLSAKELEVSQAMHRSVNNGRDQSIDELFRLFRNTKNNRELVKVLYERLNQKEE